MSSDSTSRYTTGQLEAVSAYMERHHLSRLANDKVEETRERYDRLDRQHFSPLFAGMTRARVAAKHAESNTSVRRQLRTAAGVGVTVVAGFVLLPALPVLASGAIAVAFVATAAALGHTIKSVVAGQPSHVNRRREAEVELVRRHVKYGDKLTGLSEKVATHEESARTAAELAAEAQRLMAEEIGISGDSESLHHSAREVLRTVGHQASHGHQSDFPSSTSVPLQ